MALPGGRRGGPSEKGDRCRACRRRLGQTADARQVVAAIRGWAHDRGHILTIPWPSRQTMACDRSCRRTFLKGRARHRDGSRQPTARMATERMTMAMHGPWSHRGRVQSSTLLAVPARLGPRICANQSRSTDHTWQSSSCSTVPSRRSSYTASELHQTSNTSLPPLPRPAVPS